MIRTIITPNSQTLSFNIPKKYIGKQIEIIAFEKNEAIEKRVSKNKITAFETISIMTKKFKFDRDEANER